jgi:diadenosine tetraphosphate (Ap4A) HIT family hydrolase
MDKVCEFCDEWAGGQSNSFRLNFSQELLPSRTLASTEHFKIVVGLGALREGYLLVLPSAHIRCMGYLSQPEHFLELACILKKIREVCEAHYQSPLIFFEHGNYSDDKPGGSCLDHAHIHCLPLTQSISQILDTQLSGHPIQQLMELRKPILAQKSYLFVENQAGQRFAYLVPDHLPSQYMRRIWASLVAKDDLWDWDVFLGKENILKTYQELRPYFNGHF